MGKIGGISANLERAYNLAKKGTNLELQKVILDLREEMLELLEVNMAIKKKISDLEEFVTDKTSNRQQKINKKPPLLSQILIRVISGIIITLFVYGLGEYKIFPNPKETKDNISATSTELTIENFGIMLASKVYKVSTSTPSGLEDFNVKIGEPFVDIKKTEDKKVKLVVVKDLPKSAPIQININGDNIKIEEFKINSK